MMTLRRPLLRTAAPLLAVLGLILTGGAAVCAQESPPPGGAPRDFDLPEGESFGLDNGLDATLVPYGVLPKATVSVRLRTGNIDEAADEVWLADLTGDFLAAGTAEKSAEELARAFARMGGGLDVRVTLDGTFLSADVLSEFADDAVRLLAEVVRRPAFPADETGRLVADRVRELDIALSQPQPVADRRFLELLYPEHPYGRPYPTGELLQSYSGEDVRAFWEENAGARRAHVYVVGRFDGAAVERAVREAFGDWEEGPEPTVMVPEMTSARRVHLLGRPGAVQSTLRIGLPVPDPSSDRYTALAVTNALLGGSFGSRITANIREDKGYTYSPSSRVAHRYRAAHWVQTADVTTEVTGPAIREIFGEIDRLQSEAPSADELDGIKNYLAGIFVLQNSTRAGIIGQLWFLDLHGLDRSYLTDYVQRVLDVTPEEVQRVARELLRDDEMTVVVVGDREEVEEQLEEFGEVVE